MEGIEALAAISECPDNLTRRSLTVEHKRANNLVADWMTAAGMQVRTDAIGNIIGRYPGQSDGPALLMGSHLDTVRDGGRFDGMLGVLVPIACVEQLHANNEKLPFPIEIVGFSDEEGVRFPSTLLGSRAIAGTLPQTVLDETDDCGISVATALREFGADPASLFSARRNPEDFLGFVELHIEQGPVLEQQQLPVGLVTAIASASRYKVAITGKAGHAGTVPMGMRQDALCAAAECILAIEKIAAGLADTVATVGQITALPGAGNVIPGNVQFLIDIRAPRDDLLATAEQNLQNALASIATSRQLDIEPQRYYNASGVSCDQSLSAQLSRAIQNNGYPVVEMPSGAGHDAMAMAAITPIAMLFVRCLDGISHHPDESITQQDADAAVQVLISFLRDFDPHANGAGK
jgi:allantoate deiminase